LKESETKGPASVSKFQKFRGNASGSAVATAIPAHGDRDAAADAPSADPALASSSSTTLGNSSNPSAISSSAGTAPSASEDKHAVSAHLSSAHHAEAGSVRPTSLSSSRAMPLDLRDAPQRAVDPDHAPAAVSTLKAATDARIAAVEARTLHLQAQIDRMMSQLELKDREIGGTACVMLLPPIAIA